MRSETELKNTIQRAQRAEQLLNDELIQEFIISVRGDLLNKFESTELSNEAERLSAWNQAQVLKMFLSKFTKAIKEGKDARTILEQAKHTLQQVI
jgi:hypothetical protein